LGIYKKQFSKTKRKTPNPESIFTKVKRNFIKTYILFTSLSSWNFILGIRQESFCTMGEK